MTTTYRRPGASLFPAHDVGKCLLRGRALCRYGLAPVELVLSIPLVLMVMALSVIVGNAACWKIRAAVVARNEIWSNRKPRSDTPPDPRPAGWPPSPSATMNHSGSRPLSDLNAAAFQNPLIRGPLPKVNVNAQLLDPTLAVRIGESYIQRTPPLLARMGNYSFNVQHPLIDGTWAFWQTGQGSNESRRMRDLYPTFADIEDQSPARALANQIKQQFSPVLDVLDRDQELLTNGFNTEFHPRIGRFCSLDPTFVHSRYIVNRGGLLDRITRVPRNIATTFRAMYQAQLVILQNTMPQPPDAQAQIEALQQKIQILQDYLATLP